MHIPKGHQVIMPYLMLNGAAEFISFVETVFNASLTAIQKREDDRTILHAEVQIGGCTIMFTDATAQWPPQTANMFVYVGNADETCQKALDAGATLLMALSNQDYGRTCGVTDPFGNVWWITSVMNHQ